jgi:hypothetical protein
MELRLGDRAFTDGEFAIMASGVVDDADIAEVDADPETVRTVRAAHPLMPIAVAPAGDEQAGACVRAGADLLIGGAYVSVAAATGAAALCETPEQAEGLRADGRLVRAYVPGDVTALAGHAIFVDEPSAALVSVYAWLGARVFRTGDPAETRQVLDMVASIRGTRPPAAVRRGLA